MNFKGFATLCLLTAAIMLRIFAANNELWLDEIWSLQAIQTYTGDIRGLLSSDNTHLINSLYIALIHRFSDSSFIIRGLSLVTGAAFLGLIFIVFPGAGVRSLFATSYLLILYASEARGYAAMLLGLGAAAAFVHRYKNTKNDLLLAGYSISLTLAVLSHLSAIIPICVLALFLWRTRATLAATLLPIFIFALYLYATGGALQVAGAPIFNRQDMFLGSIGWLFGLPELSSLLLPRSVYYITAVFWFALVVGGICVIDKRYRLPALGLVFLQPVILLVVQAPIITPRYLIVPLVVSLILIGSSLEFALKHKKLKVIGLTLLLLIIGLNLSRTSLLLRFGRVEISPLFYDLQSNRMQLVGGDHDARIGTTVNYLLDKYKLQNSFRYQKIEDRTSTEKPDIFIIHKIEDGAQIGINPALPDLPEQYNLVHVIPHGGLSGWTSYVYRRE